LGEVDRFLGPLLVELGTGRCGVVVAVAQLAGLVTSPFGIFAAFGRCLASTAVVGEVPVLLALFAEPALAWMPTFAVLAILPAVATLVVLPFLVVVLPVAAWASGGGRGGGGGAVVDRGFSLSRRCLVLGDGPLISKIGEQLIIRLCRFSCKRQLHPHA
jgi:hypothetical protein